MLLNWLMVESSRSGVADFAIIIAGNESDYIFGYFPDMLIGTLVKDFDEFTLLAIFNFDWEFIF